MKIEMKEISEANVAVKSNMYRHVICLLYSYCGFRGVIISDLHDLHPEYDNASL